MIERIISLLNDLDDFLAKHNAEKPLVIYHVGRSAIVWQYGATSGTRDFDLFRPADERLLQLALDQFGKDSANANKLDIYLDVVPPGLPPAPNGFKNRAIRVDGPWKCIEVYHLDPNDLAATKLSRFSSKDREDIRFLCDKGLIDETRLEESVHSAFLWITAEVGDPRRDDAFENLRIVQQYIRGELAEF